VPVYHQSVKRVFRAIPVFSTVMLWDVDVQHQMNLPRSSLALERRFLQVTAPSMQLDQSILFADRRLSGNIQQQVAVLKPTVN